MSQAASQAATFYREVAASGRVSAYEGFEPFELTLQEFMDTWLIGLVKDQFQAGLNWSGGRATGYDIEPSRVRQILAR
jgi:hypothetical protein